MGLSKENIATVLNAGVVAGYDIADALIKGGEAALGWSRNKLRELGELNED